MADSSLSSQLPLQSYSKDVPPGWKPRPYSIAKWKELLAIWLRLTRLDPEQLGAAIISRLEGPAWQTAMNLEIVRQVQQPNGTIVPITYRGVEAACLAETTAIMNPATGVMVVPAYPPGAKSLVDHLMTQFYMNDQDRAWSSLDAFFSTRQQPGEPFDEFCSRWERLFTEACANANLQTNAVCQGYLLFSQSTLSDQQITDLRLRVDGDLSRFREMVTLQSRLSRSQEVIRDQAQGYRQFGGPGTYHLQENTPESDDWYDWWFDDDYDPYHHDYDLYNEDDWWYTDDWSPWPSEQTNEEASAYAPAPTPSSPTTTTEDFYGGKGNKGKGKKGKSKQPAGSQCTNCGSKFHRPEDCPMAPPSVDSSSMQRAANHHDPWSEHWQEDYYGGKGKSSYRPRGFAPRGVQMPHRKGKGRARARASPMASPSERKVVEKEKVEKERASMNTTGMITMLGTSPLLPHPLRIL